MPMAKCVQCWQYRSIDPFGDIRIIDGQAAELDCQYRQDPALQAKTSR